MMTTISGLIEPGIKHIFKDALESELGSTKSVHAGISNGELDGTIIQ